MSTNRRECVPRGTSHRRQALRTFTPLADWSEQTIPDRAYYSPRSTGRYDCQDHGLRDEPITATTSPEDLAQVRVLLSLQHKVTSRTRQRSRSTPLVAPTVPTLRLQFVRALRLITVVVISFCLGVLAVLGRSETGYGNISKTPRNANVDTDRKANEIQTGVSQHVQTERLQPVPEVELTQPLLLRAGLRAALESRSRDRW